MSASSFDLPDPTGDPADGAAERPRDPREAESSGESIPLPAPSTGPATPAGPRAGATTRLAPSPTGPLHLGHARSFLAAWWFARAAGGRVLLRIEDLDTGRCRPEWTEAALADLAWLGLDWDGPVHVQSADLTPYHAAVERLLASGLAYACTCTRREIEEALDAPHAADEERRYPGTCRGRWPDRAAAERATGRVAGVRFRVPPGPASIEDLARGTVVADPSRECGDFLLLRRDGAVAYQLAVVVDDARQGVDLVVRGDDLAPSAVRQSLLQEALGLAQPQWLHLPLVLEADGERLSKRGGARALADLRAAGVESGHIVTWAARSLGLGGDADDAPVARDGSLAPKGPSAPAEWLDRVRVADLAHDPVRIDSSRDLPTSDGS